jgi:hypothetical protein
MPTTPTATTTSTGATTPTSSTGAGSGRHPVGGSLLAGPNGKAVLVARTQRGDVIRGSVDVAPDGAGSRLSVDLYANGSALRGARMRGAVDVGRFSRRRLHAGNVQFVVALDRAARQALERVGHLALSATVVLTSPRGVRDSVTRKLTAVRES